jgi:hypothetical protein
MQEQCLERERDRGREALCTCHAALSNKASEAANGAEPRWIGAASDRTKKTIRLIVTTVTFQPAALPWDSMHNTVDNAVRPGLIAEALKASWTLLGELNKVARVTVNRDT